MLLGYLAKRFTQARCKVDSSRFGKRLNQQPQSRFGKRKLAIVVTIVALLAVAGAYFGISYVSQSPCPNGVPLRTFTIVANDTTGYNNSRDQPLQMNVQQGDCVFVTFVNNSTTQPHGLAINYYLDHGIIAQPKTSQSARFQANKPGQFPVSEQIISTIAAWTDNAGTVNVV